MRLKRWSAPSEITTSAVTVQPLQKQPAAHGGSGYSWRQPFLRRPASSTRVTKEVPAKK